MCTHVPTHIVPVYGLLSSVYNMRPQPKLEHVQHLRRAVCVCVHVCVCAHASHRQAPLRVGGELCVVVVVVMGDV